MRLIKSRTQGLWAIEHATCYLLATKQVAVSVWHMPVAVCTVLNS